MHAQFSQKSKNSIERHILPVTAEQHSSIQSTVYMYIYTVYIYMQSLNI